MKTLSVIFASILVAFCTTMMTGCGGGGDDGGGANITGTWTGTGTITGHSGSYPTTLKLTQSGSTVSGDWDTYGVSGTFDGTTLSLTLTPFTQSGVSFTGSLSGTYDGTYINNLTMSMTGRSGSKSATVTGSVPRLTKSANLEDIGAGLGQTMSESLLSSVN
jgi:hypothetical protein